MTKIIKEVLDRKVLGEGRNQGIGFAMLQKIDENEFHTVNPISPCKDYLAEVIFTENTGYSTNGCGLDYPEKKNILSEKVSYLVFKNQKTKQSDFNVDGMTFEQFSKDLKEKIPNIINFINKYQRRFSNYVPMKIEEANEEQYLVTFDSRWAMSTMSISLFTLLLRIGKHYKSGTILSFLLNFDKKSIDYSLVNTAFKKILRIYESKKLPGIPNLQIEARKKSSSWSPHNLGICAWDETYA